MGSDSWLLELEMWFTQSIRGAKSLALNQHNGNFASWVFPIGETVCHSEGITTGEALELIVLLFRVRNKDFSSQKSSRRFYFFAVFTDSALHVREKTEWAVCSVHQFCVQDCLCCGVYWVIHAQCSISALLLLGFSSADFLWASVQLISSVIVWVPLMYLTQNYSDVKWLLQFFLQGKEESTAWHLREFPDLHCWKQ